MPWNIAVVNRRVLDLSRAMTRTVSVLNVLGFRIHARRFRGFQNVNFVRISVSEPSAFGLRFSKRSHQFFPVAPRRPTRPPPLRESATWGSDVELEAMESEQTGLTFSLPPSLPPSRLFGEAVSSVMETFRSAKMQSAALKQFMPRRTRDHSTPSSSLSREQSLHR